MEDLRAVLVRRLVHGALETGATCLEGAGGNVILKELLVDDIDDGGDQGLDVLLASRQGLDVTFRSQPSVTVHLSELDGSRNNAEKRRRDEYVLEEKSRKVWR